MAAPASEMLREVERALVLASEQGETRDFASLRDEFGLGHEDLTEGLDTLREHGKAVEAAPGEWRGPMADELGAGPAEASRPDENGDGPLQVHVPEADEQPPAAYHGSELALSEPTVRLTMGIAAALEAEPLGALIKAGIDEAREAGEIFVLEVVPSQ